MKCFKKFKAIVCLIFAFMFMFGNAFFVQASTFEWTEIQPLYVTKQFGQGAVEFVGAISYTCTLDDYSMKKRIVTVDEVSLDLSNMYACDGVRFEQFNVATAVNIPRDQIRGVVLGYLVIEEKDEDGKTRYSRRELIKIPFVYGFEQQQNMN